MIRAFIRCVRVMPAALDLAWLKWARAHLSRHNPLHPDLPEIMQRIALLKEKCRA